MNDISEFISGMSKWINQYVGIMTYLLQFYIAELVKNSPAIQETLVQFLGQEDPLEKG